MKVCVECKYCEMVQAEPIGIVYYCDNKECRDIVNGTPLTCKESRRYSDLCGRESNFWEPKE